MKKIYLAMTVMLFSALSLTAQVNVTFRVDMNTVANVADTVSVAGSFQAAAGNPNGDWQPGDTRMLDPDMDGVYEVMVSIPSGTYQYKFVNAANWGAPESVPAACEAAGTGNRELILGANDTTLDMVCFGSCSPCPLAPPDTFTVILEVDMNNESVPTDTCSVAGNFQSAAVGKGWSDWTPGAASMIDGDGDSVYTVSFRIPEGTYKYKFLRENNLGTWGSEESVPGACASGGDREMAISSDTVIRFCFGSCDAVCTPPLPPVNVTFQLDMSDEFPSSDGVFIAGNFQDPNWQKNVDGLVQSGANPDLYTFTISLVPGEYEYKYFNGDWQVAPDPNDPNNSDFYAETFDFNNGGCGIANPFGSNRLLNITGLLTDTILPAYKYNSCETTTVGIEEDLNANGAFTISPNPFSGFTTVSFSNPNGVSYNVEVMSMSGKVVSGINDLRDNKFRLEAGNLPAGMYLISLSNKAGERYTAKAIIN